MGITYSPLEMWQVEPLINQRGFKLHGTRTYGVQLTKASLTARFKDGTPMREILGGISHAVRNEILLKSGTPEEAADRMIALCHGRDVPGYDGSSAPGSVPVMDSEVMERVIKSRTDNAVALMTQDLAKEKAELEKARIEIQDMLKEMRGLLEPPTGKKRGRPKGSKNKSKTDEPELTEEQERMLKKMDFGPANIRD